MIEPQDPHAALSASQSDEHHVPGGDTPPRPRWALYARSGGDKSKRQLDILRAYAAREGAEVVAELVAGGGRRQVFELVAADAVDRVVAFSLDRLGRIPDELEMWLEAFENRSASLWVLHGIDPDGPYELTSTTGRAVLRIAAAVMSYDRQAAKDREAAIAELEKQFAEGGEYGSADNGEA